MRHEFETDVSSVLKLRVKFANIRRRFKFLGDISERDITILIGYLEQNCNYICIAYMMKHGRNE